MKRETYKASSNTTQSPNPIKSILLIAAGFGLATGLVEGIGLWTLQQFGWLRGPITFLGSGPEIIWISPILDLILFGVVGLVLGLIGSFFPRLPVLKFAVYSYVFIALFALLGLFLMGRISVLAIGILAAGLAVETGRRVAKYETALISFWPRFVTWLGVAVLTALFTIQGGLWLREQAAVVSLRVAPPNSPNILVIVVDTLRADHLASYGYSRITSPVIDRLAQEGVLFKNAFATSSWTQPSHASLLTGRYPYEHGADDASKRLDDRYPTISEGLQTRGYRTGAFSANYENFNRRLGHGRGFHHFEDYYRSLTNMASNTFYGRLIETYILHQVLGIQYRIDRKSAADINLAVLQWIDLDQTKPFFVFLNYCDVHDPYVPPPPYRSLFSGLEQPGGLINTNWDMNHIYLPLTPEQLQGEIDAYDGAIAYVDNQIGQLVDELLKRNLADNTLIIITSDHGESFGEHGLFHHANSLYREVIQVPLIFWRPEQVPKGVRITTPVTNAALPITLMDFLGDDGQVFFPGPSLARLWENPNFSVDWPYPLAEVSQLSWVPTQHLPYHGAMRAIISPQWHFITHAAFGDQLYAWPNDPTELSNLAKNSDFQPTMDQLRMHLENLETKVTTRLN